MPLTDNYLQDLIALVATMGGGCQATAMLGALEGDQKGISMSPYKKAMYINMLLMDPLILHPSNAIYIYSNKDLLDLHLWSRHSYNT